MYGIFLINDAGETIASIGWENLKGDSSLFGGFLSAVQMFIKKISGTEIEELRFGDLKLLVGHAGTDYVVTLHAFDDEKAEHHNREVVKLVNESSDIRIDDGFLELVSEMVIKEIDEAKKAALDEAKKAASDWGKKVF
jgi:hypothetical protein